VQDDITEQAEPRSAIPDAATIMARVFAMRGSGWRMIPAGANGQPAVAAYCPDDTGTLRLHTLQVLTVTAAGIAHNVVFQDPRVFTSFQLAPVLEPRRRPHPASGG
jgi:RNA polymerase sigma-70 factor (ECF subfamily)